MFLNGNFVAIAYFKERYGVVIDGKYSITTEWQSALFQAGQCGAFVGVFLAGPLTTWLGYRLVTFWALILMTATIFISFFVSAGCSVGCMWPGLLTHITGRLPRSSCYWTSFRRRPMGHIHCKQSSVRQRGGATCPPRSSNGNSADVLVHRWNSRGRNYLRFQQPK